MQLENKVYLVICTFLSEAVTSSATGADGAVETQPLLPEPFATYLSKGIAIITLLLFVYAVYKYFKLKKEIANGTRPDPSQQPIHQKERSQKSLFVS